MLIQKEINQLDSMYPTFSGMLDQHNSKNFKWPDFAKWASIYGYCFSATDIVVNNVVHKLSAGQYFSFFNRDSTSPIFTTEGNVFVVCRLGYKCQDVTGWVEKQGRLSYIDGCSDSLLIYPPRQGDPSLNLLHFPSGVEQSPHLHPSIRMGCVVSGSGYSDVWENGKATRCKLTTGDMFCLEENEVHRFVTTDSQMTVIAWHPDGDWGPTDHNHTMINRTYLTK
jgi:quercetin dioxygenase-like cupin family protein